MNNSTKTALAIIEQRENENNEPAFALWVEIFNGVIEFDLTPEQMQRELNAGIESGYLIKHRGLNGDIYLRGNGEQSTI